MSYGDVIVTIDKFLGLNEDIAGDTQLKMGESPNMNNFRITELGKLLKREGYSTIISSIGNQSITGMWYGKVNNVDQLVFSATNNNIYKITGLFNVDGNVAKNNIPFTPTIIGTTSVSNPVSFFYFDTKLYFVNGADYKCYDGVSNFTDVTPYVPLIKTACKPDGTGTDYETLNLLTGNRYQVFNGDGTSTIYQLAETNLTSIYAVYVFNGTSWVSTTVTKDLPNGKITFSTAPANGSLNVKVYYSKGTGSPSEILSQKFATIFNKELLSRVFVYGNLDPTIAPKNRVYYSGKRVDTQKESCEYFPALNYVELGDTQYPVTGIISQYDRLIVSKTKDTHYITMTVSSDFSSKTGDSIVTVASNKLNDSIGNVAPGQQQIILNNPFVISNGVFEFTNTTVKDERNAKYMSKRVNQTLDTAKLENAITTEYQAMKEYWLTIGKTTWVHNYAWDVWYKFNFAHTPTVYLEINGVLFFGTTDGRIMYFDEANMTDAGTLIASHWESGFMDFGSSWQRKYLNRMWISTKPGIPTDLQISWETDGGFAQATTDIFEQSLLNFGNINFGAFSFDTSDNPKPKLLKIKAKKFSYFKLLVDSAQLGATVLAFNLSIRKGGASK